MKCNCQRDKQKKEEYKMTRRRTEEENKTMKIVFISSISVMLICHDFKTEINSNSFVRKPLVVLRVWVDDIKIDAIKTCFEGLDSVELAWNKVRWTVMCLDSMKRRLS